MSLPSLDEIKDADEEFWRWIFHEKDGPNHPLKISGPRSKAQTRLGRILIIAGALSGDPVAKQRSLEKLDGIDYIFAPADNCIYTRVDGDGADDQVLVDNANRDMATGTGNVSVNGNNQALNLLPGHPFRPELNIQERIIGTGKSKKGEGWKNSQPPGQTIAAAACHYAIIRANALRSGDTIRITGEVGTGIDVSYTVL